MALRSQVQADRKVREMFHSMTQEEIMAMDMDLMSSGGMLVSFDKVGAWFKRGKNGCEKS